MKEEQLKQEYVDLLQAHIGEKLSITLGDTVLQFWLAAVREARRQGIEECVEAVRKYRGHIEYVEEADAIQSLLSSLLKSK